MNCIEMMMEEHENIKKMLKVIRKMCYGILKGEDPVEGDFRLVIDFVRGYADGHHHGKEEDLLFERMLEELKGAPAKFIRNGMMVEHELGRFHIGEVEAALNNVIKGDDESRMDLIANAISYASLLNRHIDKEDNVLYKYALNNLSPETLARLDADSTKLEENSPAGKYLEILKYLEGKY